jgi:AcrR family transcriptional regulator
LVATLGTPPTNTPAEIIAAAAMRLAGRKGWRRLALGDIAAEAGVTLAELARNYSSRPEILDGFERMIDRRMLAGAAAGDIDDAPRDRLFDVIMERFDALLPYRDGVRRVTRGLPFDPPSSLVLAFALPRSVSWMFTGARIAIDGPTMPLRLMVLGGAYLSTFRVWLDDDTQDLARTMATLDRQLDRAQRLLAANLGQTQPAEPPAAPQPAPAVAAPEPVAAPPKPEPPSSPESRSGTGSRPRPKGRPGPKRRRAAPEADKTPEPDVD